MVSSWWCSLIEVMMAVESAALSFLWKDSLTERLIELFKGNPCLYDTKCADYHNRDLKKKILEEMAGEVGTTSKCSSPGQCGRA